ncbi:MAG TPA: hypothetical protein VK993_06365 [Chthoniobacterales bacterium]|nr:hypothetical protein [Chthoniobacterales bacterium]
MFLRVVASAVLLFGASFASAQEAFTPDAVDPNGNQTSTPHSAWIDLRQHAASHSNPQSAPAWLEAVTLVPIPPRQEAPPRTVFRIRVTRPRPDLQLLMLRLFFDDKPGQQPTITAWDESGSHILRSGTLGAGIDLPSSDTVILPMLGISCIDIEVPGDGTTLRGAFMDWMVSRNVAHPLSAHSRDVMPEPFAAAAPLHVPEQDTETFGTVTATLAPETIRIAASVQQGAAFQFGIEALPLMALISFEVSTPRVDSPPEVYLNGENLGPASMTLPDLADPGYRGESERLVAPMRFSYTGWVRGQKLVPAASLKVGTNDLLVISGPGTPVSAIRGTQIQLKYLWDKSDYLLQPNPQSGGH